MTITTETIQLIKKAQATRAIQASSGFSGYDLEDAAKALVPIITPLRNRIPRAKGKGARNHEWRAITSLDTARLTGVSTEGGAPGRATYATATMTNAFKTLTIGNDVTFDAEWTGAALEGDMLARRRAELLWLLMIIEERAILNWSRLLMRPAAPVLATATTGGTVAAGTYWVQVAAYNANGETLPSTQAATTSDGAGVITTTGATSTIAVTIFTIPNATNYRVYIGSGSTPPANGAMWLQSGLSGTNAPQPAYASSVSLASGGALNSGEVQGPMITVTLTAAPATSGTNPVTDASASISAKDSGTNDPQMWDGLIAQAILNTGGSQGAGSYLAQPTSSDGLVSLSDFDSMLLSIYQNHFCCL